MTPRVVEPAREQQVGQLRDEIVDVDLVEQVAGVFGVPEFHGYLLLLVRSWWFVVGGLASHLVMTNRLWATTYQLPTTS
jgi:hypothetical protein